MRREVAAALAAGQRDAGSAARHGERLARLGSVSLVLLMAMAPELAHAQAAAGILAPVTNFLKAIAQTLILDWGYYIGIIALAVQGIRCWRGHIDIMAFGVWAIGIIAVFFAPNIVQELRAGAAVVI